MGTRAAIASPNGAFLNGSSSPLRLRVPSGNTTAEMPLPITAAARWYASTARAGRAQQVARPVVRAPVVYSTGPAFHAHERRHDHPAGMQRAREEKDQGEPGGADHRAGK